MWTFVLFTPYLFQPFVYTLLTAFKGQVINDKFTTALIHNLFCSPPSKHMIFRPFCQLIYDETAKWGFKTRLSLVCYVTGQMLYVPC